MQELKPAFPTAAAEDSRAPLGLELRLLCLAFAIFGMRDEFCLMQPAQSFGFALARVGARCEAGTENGQSQSCSRDEFDNSDHSFANRRTACASPTLSEPPRALHLPRCK